MSERQRERAWMVIAVIVIGSVFIIGMSNKANSMTLEYALTEVEAAGWCDNNDDMVKDINGVCHDIDKFIDAYVDANPPPVDPACQEDEQWIVVHYQDPRGREDNHGVTRACVHYEQAFIEALTPYILDGTLIWEWDL